MSAKTLEFIAAATTRFNTFAASPERASVKDTDITQYNITIDGKVVNTLVFNLKDFVLSEKPVDNADLEITIDDADVVDAFLGKKLFVDLLSAVSFICVL